MKQYDKNHNHLFHFVLLGDPPRFCRSAMRRWLDEDRGGPDIGFRVALVPVDSDGKTTEAKQ